MVHIFVDTEFTDFIDTELLSIGFSTSDKSFYGENAEASLEGCSDFTKAVVLPLLWKKPDNVYRKLELGKAVLAWLEQFKEQNPILMFDGETSKDFFLLHDLLGRDFPPWLRTENVHNKIDEVQFKNWINDLFDGVQHHALHDAICNRLAYVPVP